MEQAGQNRTAVSNKSRDFHNTSPVLRPLAESPHARMRQSFPGPGVAGSSPAGRATKVFTVALLSGCWRAMFCLL